MFFISTTQVIADSRQIIEYQYDASGNLIFISPEDRIQESIENPPDYSWPKNNCIKWAVDVVNGCPTNSCN